MQLREGAGIYTAEGKRVGSLDRVVLDPQSKEVSAIVVRKGVLLGEDKVVPISLLGTVSEEGRIELRPGAGDLQALPAYVETEYVPSGLHATPDTDYSGVYWYPAVGASAWTWGVPPAVNRPVPEYTVATDRNIPEGTVALKTGAKVISSDDERVGDIEEVLTEPEADRATHFVVSEGVLLKQKKLIPTHWISTVLEDRVLLSVDAQVVENLPEYEK